jgi:lysophospholipase L1-like esterase
MILRPYHHIILCKNELDVSTNDINGIFFLILKHRNWLRQPMTDRIDFTHDANQISRHGVLSSIAMHVMYEVLRYTNLQPRGQPRDARAPS